MHSDTRGSTAPVQPLGILDFNLIPQQIVLSSIQYLHCGKTGSLRLSSKEQSLFLEPFFLNGPFPTSFSLFLSFQYTVDSKQMFNI